MAALKSWILVASDAEGDFVHSEGRILDLCQAVDSEWANSVGHG